jgi:hypothetical protein
MVDLTVPLAWGQATEPGMAGSPPIAPAAISPVVPPERIAPGVPGIPPNVSTPLGNGPGGSRADAMKADYLAKKIVDAHPQGRNAITPESQEAIGKTALTKGHEKAARHSETALRSMGVIPIGLDQDAGQSNSENQRTRDAN